MVVARDLHRISLWKGQGILKTEALERLKMRWHILKWILQTCCDDVPSSYYAQWKFYTSEIQTAPSGFTVLSS